jgi:hypothetical protein
LSDLPIEVLHIKQGGVDEVPRCERNPMLAQARQQLLDRQRLRLDFVSAAGLLGRAYCEASEDRSDLETTISDLISGQYDNPVRIVAFNTAERSSEDVSHDIAREIMRRLGGDELPSSLEGFIDQHLGPDRQLALRLA